MDWSKLINNSRLRKSNRIPDARNDFESDFGRVVFSPAVRRMHDKTQVFPLTDNDNIHSRLTHSMEVMSIGHTMAVTLCDNEDFLRKIGFDYRKAIRIIPSILKSACLVHDIGNPPFGHFGETVIQNFFSRYFLSGNAVRLDAVEEEDFTLFDGNAQGFRVLTKLQKLDDDKGLNLTFGTLASYLKYPNAKEKNKKIISKKKRGVFQSEVKVLKHVANECGLNKGDIVIRHPLCFLMEAADSICYLVMDIEDGFNKQLYSYEFIKSEFSEIEGISERLKKIESEVQNQDKLTRGSIDTTRVAHFRIYLIQRLVNKAIENFHKNLDSIMEGDYNEELIFDDDTKLAEKSRSFCFENVFPKRDITSLELTGHSVLTGLLDYYVRFIFHENEDYRRRAVGLISKSIVRVSLLENGFNEKDSFDKLSNYYKFRVIVDFISGMTDQFALNHYQRLNGQKII
jgi:dGTPase